MLPKRIDCNSEDFSILSDPHGKRVLLVSRDQQAAAAAGRPTTPLWSMECGDDLTLNALTRWFALNRAQWQDLGLEAERTGHALFHQTMRKRLDEATLGVTDGYMLRINDDGRSIDVGEILHSRNGLVQEILLAHDFGSSGRRARFLDWFHTDGREAFPQFLVTLAFNEGTEAASTVLEKIVDEEVANDDTQLDSGLNQPRQEAA